MAVQPPFKAAVIVLETEQWKDIKDLFDAGFEKLQQDQEDEAYMEMITRTWSQVRNQLKDYGIVV